MGAQGMGKTQRGAEWRWPFAISIWYAFVAEGSERQGRKGKKVGASNKKMANTSGKKLKK